MKGGLSKMGLPVVRTAVVAVAVAVPAIVALNLWLKRAARSRASKAARVVNHRQTATAEARELASRELPLRDARTTAILVVDMQNFCCDFEHGGGWTGKTPPEHLVAHMPAARRNIKRLLDAARAVSAECIFTVIESLTADGRDRSLDYKISGFHVPRGSWDAQVVEDLRPTSDEILIPKCSAPPTVTYRYLPLPTVTDVRRDPDPQVLRPPPPSSRPTWRSHGGYMAM